MAPVPVGVNVEVSVLSEPWLQNQPPSAIASLPLPPFPSLGATPLKNALNECFISPASLLHLRSQPCQSIRDTIDLKRKQ